VVERELAADRHDVAHAWKKWRMSRETPGVDVRQCDQIGQYFTNIFPSATLKLHV
jgi:hypothetical protein